MRKVLDNDRLMIALAVGLTVLVFAVFELVFGGGAGFGAVACMWMLILFVGLVAIGL
jgi:hypothetical protein